MADFLLGGQIDAARHERTGTTTTVSSGDLTTHGVIVGMTGSGKTGLGIVLIEEALQAGIPTLLIDPKGDLTNLCLTFPNLAPTDFEPWVNEGDAKKAGVTVPEFAAAQAKTWTEGLGGWGLGGPAIKTLRDSTTFTIYTPGSSGGVGLNIIGSLQAPPDMTDMEILGDEIEGFVSGLLSLVDIDADPLSSREHILLSNLILHEWSAGRNLDLATLVGMAQTPPIRKLGVFDVDAFFPPKDRTAFAMRLNGLLASPSFGAWLNGPPLDIPSMLRTPDGRPRCAIVTTAHLSDQERQFVTTLVLSKLVTWMRGQSGTTDLRALLYMDEVAGYLPPTAVPPTKKPIMTLMKQARAFGLGVVLSTQNPVDIDYKALSNAGTWMIGRLQTERDKQRLLDGMSAAAGGVDVGAVSDTISGLAKREFVVRRAGKDTPDVFTTRWAMSYLRGPLTRDQIATLMVDQKAAAPTAPPTATTAGGPPAPPAASPGASPAAPAPAGGGAFAAPPSGAPTSLLPPDVTAVMPGVAEGVLVRWVDVAAPWVSTVGGDPRGGVRAAAIVARVALRYDEVKADLVHDEEYETVLFPLADPLDVTAAMAVDHDDRDLQPSPPPQSGYRIPDAPIKNRTFWTRVEKDLLAQLVRTRSLDLHINRDLKLCSRPGEDAEAFVSRCLQVADIFADADIAKFREKYATKVAKLQDQLRVAEDRVDIVREEAKGRRNEELLSTAGSILGGILGGRRSRGSVFSKAGSAAGRRSRTAAAGGRADAAENKVEMLQDQLQDLEAELVEELTEIDQTWMAMAKNIAPLAVPLERTDVRITQLALAWLPVS